MREIDTIHFDFTETNMKKILTAIALSIALPAVAHAQTEPAKADCCEKHDKMDCCKDMAGMDHAERDMKGMDSHAMHNMSRPGAKVPQANPQQNHQQ
ncbi:MAG: hypothetical protein ABIT68_10595 [Sphingomicrobium sp.]